MVNNADERQPGEAPLAAFDFDGTLTTRDSFTAFLAWRGGPWRFAAGLVTVAPAALRFCFDRDRTRLKSAATGQFLAGAPLETLEAEAAAFAAGPGARMLRRDALDCWEEWRRRGARLVIVTATPEPIVRPFARALAADHLIGTLLAINEAGRVTGDFVGPNCRGPEKVRRLRAAFGDHVRLAAAYGDSAGDREMLTLAEEQGMKVFKSKGGVR